MRLRRLSRARAKGDRTMGSNKPFEAEARRVLQLLLGGEVVDRDEGAAQGVRDFDLVGADGAVDHAIEVTSIQHPLVRATRGALKALTDEEVGLQQSWSITVHEDVHVRAIRRRGVALFNALTEMQVSTFGFGSQLDPHQAAPAETINQLRGLGILGGHVLTAIMPPRFDVATYGAGSPDPVGVTNKVQEQLDKADNRRKLDAAPTGATRHLFVGIDHSDWYVSSQLLGDDLRLPPAPQIPAEVDVVWVAVEDPSSGRIGTLLRSEGGAFIALNPGTGAQLEVPASDGGPPATAPICTECGGSSHWEARSRKRYDPKSHRSIQISAWSAFCDQDPGHFESLGRAMTEREQRENAGP